MHSRLAHRISAIFIAQVLLAGSTVLPQEQSREENRPRRVLPSLSSAPSVPSSSGTITTPDTPPLGPEPKIRIALATGARSAVISTIGKLMNASEGQSTLIALNTSRVQVEPRLLSPIPAKTTEDSFQLTTAASTTRDEAEQLAHDVKKLTGEDTRVIYDTEAKTWGLLIGESLSREEAEELRARLEDSGFDATVKSLAQKSASQVDSDENSKSTSQTTTNQKIRLAARPSFAIIQRPSCY